MKKFSEKSLIKNCPHCDPDSFAYRAILEQTDNFSIVCDVHPLIEGHILIIPKRHISCIGEYSLPLLSEFTKLNDKVSKFLKEEFDSVSSFEHGKIGQTVFHSHVHLLPFKGTPKQIIPEGVTYLTKLNNIDQLQDLYKKDNQYLFFTMEDMMWVVDIKLGAPRFFRDRFALALGVPERGNWKIMHEDKKNMLSGNQEIKSLQFRWLKYFSM